MSESAHSELPFTRESQTAQILKHLQSGQRITAIEALDRFRSFRLGGRCFELRQQGWNIKSRIVETKSGKHVSEYWLDLSEPRVKVNGHKKPSLRDLAKLYIESLPESEKLNTQLVLSKFIIWFEDRSHGNCTLSDSFRVCERVNARG